MYKVLSFLKKEGFTSTEFLFLNYYWLITIGGVFYLITGLVLFDNVIIPLLVYPLIFFRNKTKVSPSVLDFLWWLCFLWGCSTWIWNSYDNKEILIFMCFIEQLTYMMSYWIVRKNKYVNVDTIIQSSYLPVLITAALGILFMFYEPSWYATRTNDFVTDFDEFQAKRLRSIFSDGYIIMYYCGIVLIYEFFVIAKGVHKKYVENSSAFLSNSSMHMILVIICFITIFMGMQRAVIVSALIAMFISLYYAFHYTTLKNSRGLIISLIVVVISSFISLGFMSDIQKGYYSATVLEMVDNSSELATERLIRNKSQKEYDFWGDGTGRHNMYADKYNKGTSMRDGEYNKLLTEQGYIGAFLYGLFAFCALLKCFNNFRGLGFEFAMLVFLFVSMIGANSLSTYDKHPILFWMIFGQIANYSNKRKYGYNKIVNNNSNV